MVVEYLQKLLDNKQRGMQKVRFFYNIVVNHLFINYEDIFMHVLFLDSRTRTWHYFSLSRPGAAYPGSDE